MVKFNVSIVSPIFKILGLKAPVAKVAAPVTPAQAVRMYTYYIHESGKITSRKPSNGNYEAVKAPNIALAALPPSSSGGLVD